MELTSINNERVKFWQKLNQKKYRDIEKLFLVEDEHLVTEALKKGIVKEIIALNKEEVYDVPTYYVTDKIMNVISTGHSRSEISGTCGA